MLNTKQTASGQPALLCQLSQAERMDLIREDHDLYLIVGALETYSAYAYLADFERCSDGLRRMAARFLSDRRDYSQVQLRDMVDYVGCALAGFLRLRELRGDRRATVEEMRTLYRAAKDAQKAKASEATRDARWEAVRSAELRLSAADQWAWKNDAAHRAMVMEF